MLRTSGGFLTVSQKHFLGEFEGRAMIVLDAILCSFCSVDSCAAGIEVQAIVSPSVARRLPGALGARHGHEDRSNHRNSGRETTS